MDTPLIRPLPHVPEFEITKKRQNDSHKWRQKSKTFHWKRYHKYVENAGNNYNKAKTEGRAKLPLPWERAYGRKSNPLLKKHGIEVTFTRGQICEIEKLNMQRKEARNTTWDVKVKGVMKYIGPIGGQLKIRMKE